MQSRTRVWVLAVCLASMGTGAWAQATTQPASAGAVLAVPEGLKGFKPTLVTLKVQDMPVLEAMEQLGRQANVSFGVWPDWVLKEVKDKKVTANLEGVPFWQAADEVAGQAGLTALDVDFENPRKVSLRKRDNAAAVRPVSVCGPITFDLNSISYSRKRDFDQAQSQRTAEVRFGYRLDPALESGDFGAVAVLSEMKDDKGQSLLLKTPEKEHWTSGSAGKMVGSTFSHLEYMGETGAKCQVLRGTVAGTFTLVSDIWEVDLATAAGQTHKAGQIAVTITKCQVSPGKCELSVNIKATAKKASGVADGVTYGVTGSDGVAWRRRNYGGGGWMGNLNYSMEFVPADKQSAAAPAKVVIRTPTDTAKCEVPFEFRDFPLP